MKLRFPAIGSTRTLPIFEPPERGDSETDEQWKERLDFYEARKHIVGDFELVDRETAIGWSLKMSAALAKDAKRIHDLKASSGVETLWGMTLEGAKELAALNIETAACLRQIRGIEVETDTGIIDLATITGPELVSYVKGCDLLGPVAAAARRAQTLKPAQVEH